MTHRDGKKIVVVANKMAKKVERAKQIAVK